MSIKLLIGADKQVVDTEDISDIAINLSIKDITNYSSRNASFSKPITIWHTKNTDRIFKGLFNIGSNNSYDMYKKVPGILLEDDVVILNGSIQVTGITPYSYEIVVFDDLMNMFIDMGDKMLVGNVDASNDVISDPSMFRHKITRYSIQDSLRSTPLGDGTDYFYPIIDYDGMINSAGYLSEIDYPLFPAISAKLVFDKLFESNGYTYEMSADILDKFKKMYIPFNDSYKNWSKDMVIKSPHLGRAEFLNDGIHEFTNDEFTSEYEMYSDIMFTPQQINVLDRPLTDIEKIWNQVGRGGGDIPTLALKGLTYYDYGDVNLYKDEAYYPLVAPDDPYHYGIRIPSDGEYTITGNFVTTRKVVGTKQMIFTNYVYRKIDASANANITYKLIIPDLVESNYDICDVKIDASASIPPTTKYYTSGTVKNLKLKKDMIVYVVMHPADVNVYKLDPSTNEVKNLLHAAVVYEPSTYISIVKNGEYVEAGNWISAKDMIPKDYKQSEFVNDVFKTFNAYVTPDIVPNKLNIQSYNSFFSSPSSYDWSSKLIENSCKFSSFGNESGKRYVFSQLEDSDYYSDDFMSWKGYPLYGNILTSESEFAKDDVEINLNYAPAALKNIADGLYVPKIFDINNSFKTDWKNRMLFFNSVDHNYRYGVMNDTSANVTKWNILSPRLYNDLSTNNMFIGFNSKYTYITDITEETNNTLYNLYYKDEIESILSPDSRILRCKMRLNVQDVNGIKFNSRIYINNKTIGNGVYRLNSIKNYTSSNSVCDVELIKINV